MVFGLHNESTAGARSPGEEFETLHRRVKEKQERLNISPASAEEREQLVSQELATYRAELPEDVLASDLRMNEQDIILEARSISLEKSRQMDDLLEILVEKGLKNTLSVVDKINNPHLADDFHRFLVQYLSEGMDVRGLEEGTLLFKALHMQLFEITLPDITDTDTQDFKQLVRAMEQFYSGMLSIHEASRIRRYFTIEIALSSSSNDVVLYVAVPTAKTALFEKQIMSTFPSAHIVLSKKDYNPFNAKGVSAGSVGRLVRPAILPIKTFELFEQDPLNVILGVFSKMKHHGEGAAIQLVVAPSGGEMNRKYQEVLKDVKKGVSLTRAMEGMVMKISRGVFETAKEVFGSRTKKQEEEVKKDIDVDENEVKAIAEKISSPIIYVNVRIIGSGDTQARANEIVSDLESAFHQFSNEPLNSIVFRKMNDSGLKQLLHDFSFRLYSEKYAIPLNLKEVTTMFHFPVTHTLSAELKQSKLLSAPAPMDMNTQGIFLGVNNHRGVEKNVHFDTEDRMRHFYVIGQTGTGKTTLLKNMIMQDIVNGEGVCYIDPHGTDIEDILNAVPPHRKQDVIYFDPSDTQRPIGLNMLEYDPLHPEQKIFVVNELFSIFKKLYANSPESMGPAFEQYFRNATMLVLEDPASGNTLLEVSRVLADARFREMKLSHCKNPIVVQFWREIASKAGGDASLANIVPYITNKFDVFLSNDIMRAIVAQEHSSFQMREVMDSRKILLINLAKGRLGDINSHLIGLILVGKILMAALSRVDAFGMKPANFYLYIDEFQNVTTDSISSILSEARKYRLSLTMAHQFIAQLEEGIRNSVFGNVGSMAVFRVGAEDADYLEGQFAPVFSKTDIMKIPNRNAYVKMLVNGFPAKPFNMETVVPFTGQPEVGREIKDMSRKKYGRDRTVIEATIAEKYVPPTKIQTSAPQTFVAPVQATLAQQSTFSSPPQTTRPVVVPNMQAVSSPKQVVQSPIPSLQTPPPIQQQTPASPPQIVPPIVESRVAPETNVPPKVIAPAVPVAQTKPIQQKFSSMVTPQEHKAVQMPRRAGAAVYTNPFNDSHETSLSHTQTPTVGSSPVEVPAYGFATTDQEQKNIPLEDTPLESFFDNTHADNFASAPIASKQKPVAPQKLVVPVAPATRPVIVSQPLPSQNTGLKGDPYREIPE